MRRLTHRSWSRAGLGLLALGLAEAATIAPAAAQIDSREGIALQNQIYALRQEIQQMRDQLARGGGGGSSAIAPRNYPSAAPNDLVAQLLTRVDALEEQVRQLRGQEDETRYALQRQGAELGKRIDDLAFQVNPQGAGAGAATGAPAAASSAPQQAAPPPPQAPAAPVRRTPELALQEGNNALARRDYTAAEQAAREVLNTARTSPRAYDAQFLLAEALAGQRQFPQAAIAFDDAYNRNRKGARAPDALLGLANALTALNEKRAACDTLTKLGSEFPQLRSDLQASAASVRQRAGCR